MSLQDLYKNIFNTSESATGGTAALLSEVNEHPYFSLAHFFLLKQTGADDAGYNRIAAKTALHFNHPFFLHHQLYKDSKPVAEEKDEFIFSGENSGSYINTDETRVVPQDHIETVFEELPVTAETTLQETMEYEAPAIPAEEEEMIYETVSPATVDTEEPSFVIEYEEPISAREQVEPTYNDYSTAIEEIKEQEKEMQEAVEATEAIDMNPPASIEEAAQQAEREDMEMAEHLAQANHRFLEMANVAREIQEKDNGTKENKADAFVFEPLFATDYFASQGIKLREEALTDDKLGKQLRSFTDWLKTMKRVHESKLPPGSPALDLSVQTLAEKSNKEEDIVTETMAEVFLQQGKRYKAKEIYRKLSLLNPSKNAYFAAKIEQIQ
jgi:hypothetical protein